MEIRLWKDREKGLINPELFSGTAEKLAREIADDGKDGKKDSNKQTKIRKYYDEILRFDARIQGSKDEFEHLLPYLKMLNAKAAYDLARGLVTEKFRDLVKSTVKQVNTPADVKVLKGFFEAFMGYYKLYKKD